jgi:hypothetical protein
MASAESPAELLSLIVEAVSQPEIPPDVTEVRIISLHKSSVAIFHASADLCPLLVQ